MQSAHTWDLIVDLGRAPLSTYEDWSRIAGCRVISLYDFAEEIDDLYRVKALLQFGMGEVVDHFAIDWWDVCSALIVEDILRLILVRRLAEELGNGCELYVTRPDPLARILQSLCAGELHNLESRFQPSVRSVKHYAEAFAKLDPAQVIQVLRDKYDPEHAIRRRLAFHRRKPEGPVTLLPSCYINVSRMAVAYATLLPDEQFRLIWARASGRLQSLPPNVSVASLDPYFVRNDPREIASLSQRWETLRARLVDSDQEFAAANANGSLGRIATLIKSGVAARNAWNRVFETENVTGCLCADDTAPYTRIPLILAKNRGLPALACHHGALDLRMAVKKLHADVYFAKGPLERDYLLSVCRVEPKLLVGGAPPSLAQPSEPVAQPVNKDSMVFFTEPYEVDAWRIGEVYRDLLPRLCSVAKACRLRLVFKLHPFESIKSIRRLLRKYLSPSEEREIHVLSGQISPQLWQSTKFALTVQSTVALECCARKIPVFLCSWLRAPFGGYIRQYASFGAGCILDSPQELAEIPRLLEEQNHQLPAEGFRWQTIDPVTLRKLLHGMARFPQTRETGAGHVE